MRDEVRDWHGGQEAGKLKKGAFVASTASGRLAGLKRSVPGLGDEESIGDVKGRG